MSSASGRLRARAAARHRVGVQTPELNLNSMMDMFAVLIPALLMMSAVVEVTLLNIAVPALDGAATASAPPKPPLDLTVTILADGYRLSVHDGILLGAGIQPTPAAHVLPTQLTLPLVQKRLRCAHYQGTWPPPRHRNMQQAACADPQQMRDFWTYDLAGLTARISALKAAYPDERRLIVDAAPEVEYESVIDLMDATRDLQDPATGQVRPLFDEVLLSPGL
jgi:biopolymer transport protein ExbD